MKKWGKNRNLIFAKQDLTVNEVKEVMDNFTDFFDNVNISITISGEEPGTWEKMVEVNKATAYKLEGAGREYDLNFKDRQYLCDGEPFYMTDSEARACYFMLTSDVVVDGFGDVAMNMKRRLKHSTVLNQLYDGDLTIVEKKC